MSDAESSRIEAQIAGLGELLQQSMSTMQQNMNAMREDITTLLQRVDSIEGTVIVTT